MILTALTIHQVRAIEKAHLLLNPRFNFIVGGNGSGKTSILEALYLLSCGHSFRTREVSPIVTHYHEAFTVFARAEEEQTISIQKSVSASPLIKLNGIPCMMTSQLAYALPCQVIYSDLFQIIDAGPSVRRNVLDWGLFHVKHEYLNLWKEYRRVLKQRNALLKTHTSYHYFVPWDKQLVALAEQLDQLRKEYFALLEHQFHKIVAVLTDSQCSINYFRGWDRRNAGKDLEQILVDSFSSDKQKQYTQYGAHNADIVIESLEFKAKHALSRGQQKIILISLKLAQGLLINKDCLYLFDDFAAELDENHQERLLAYLTQHPGQFVITSIFSPKIRQLAKDQFVNYKVDAGCVERFESLSCES